MTAGSGRQVARLMVACEVLLALFLVRGAEGGMQLGVNAGPGPMPTPSPANSGIYGHLSTALGNAPASPLPVRCFTVYESPGGNFVATGMCSGAMGDFRVPLAPGRYLVEFSGRWEAKNGAMGFIPDRRSIVIGPAQWIKLVPQSPLGPVP